MKKIIAVFTAAIVMLVFYGCSKEFLDTQNINSINSDSFYTNEAEAIQAVTSVYAGLQLQGLYHRRIFFMLDFASDEIDPTPNTQTPPSQLLGHTFDANNEHIVGVWGDSYITIARANIALENIEKIEMNATLQNRLLGEVRFIRALSYLNLVQNFGGVPLRVHTNEESTNLANWPRATEAEIFALIEEDLKFAESNLPARSEYGADDLGRATSGAAGGLLAKAYIYQEKWDDASKQCDKVIDSGEYALVEFARLMNSFNQLDENNEESLFEVQFTANLNGGGGAWAVDQNTGWGGNGEGNFRPKEYGVNGFAFYNAKPSDELVAAFEADDPRLQAFFFGPGSTFNGVPYDTIFDESGYAWAKYTDPAPGASGALDDGEINIRVLRFADILLLKAEALIQLGNAAEGLDYINQVRRRADPSGSILADRTDASQALDYLIHERRVELCGEQQRRIDLVRWGIADQFLTGFSNGKHEVFPIPGNELDTNTEVQQNAGY
ncbi:MAG: RagB/SusD family nutrient uptake outer membrane protein [Bacteroidota bacterium]